MVGRWALLGLRIVGRWALLGLRMVGRWALLGLRLFVDYLGTHCWEVNLYWARYPVWITFQLPVLC